MKHGKVFSPVFHIILGESQGEEIQSKKLKIDQNVKLGQLELVSVVPNPNECSSATCQDDLFCKIRWFIIIGKILGILPFTGVFQKSFKNLSVTCYSASSIASMIFILFLGLNTALECFQAIQVSKENAVELAVSVKAPIYYGYGLFVYLYFFVRGRKFIDLFHYWAKTRTSYFAPDLHLSRDIGLLVIVMMTSAVLENAFLHLKYFQAFDNLNDVILFGYNERPGGLQTQSSVLEVYYRRSHYDWGNVLGYSEVYAVLIFIANKITLYSWNYVDLFMCVCGRSLYFRFQTLYEKSKKKLFSTESVKKTGLEAVNPSTEQQDWENIIRDHNSLCSLLKEFEKVLSPLIFLSYLTNVFYICIQVYMSLHSEDSGPESLIHSIYVPWSLLHLGMRTYFVSINLARVNEYAHKIMDVIKECPLEYYDRNMSRFDQSITCGRKIGFTGLGCFVVSKPFMLRVIGVLFTLEIVLLQGSTSSIERECCCDTPK